MAVVKKISELTPKGSAIGANDLVIVGVSNGNDYDLKSVTGNQLVGAAVAQTITNGVTTTAPSQDAVFDALANKVDVVSGSRLITSAEATVLSNTSGTNTGDQDLSGYLNGSSTTANLPDSTDKRYVTDSNLLSIARIDVTISGNPTIVGFSRSTDYGTSAVPLTNASFTDSLSGAVRGLKAKIYHNSATAPTFPANWVKISGEYIPSTLNIIEAYYSGTSTRVEYSYINDVSLKQPYTTATTGSVISFAIPQVYNSPANPSSSNITDDLTGAKIGIVQKIYSNKAVAPTFPAGWVLMGTGTYTTSTLNVIFAEWVSSTRVEYWITKPA